MSITADQAARIYRVAYDDAERATHEAEPKWQLRGIAREKELAHHAQGALAVAEAVLADAKADEAATA